MDRFAAIKVFVCVAFALSAVQLHAQGLTEIDQQLATQRAHIKALTEDEKALQSVVDVQRRKLAHALSQLLIASESGFLSTVLDSGSTEDLAFHRYIFNNKAKSDLAIKHQYQALLADKKSLQAELQKQNNSLAQLKKARQDQIARILSDKALLAKAASERAEQQHKLSGFVQKLWQHGSRHLPGRVASSTRHQFLWPVKGSLLHHFGETSPATLSIESQGLHVRANEGTPVHAISDGKAVFVGWMRGFGRMVIVEHDEGLHSLYAHLQDFAVEQGGKVERGQVLGYVGDTESLDGAKLYFELRKKGVPLNPLPYLESVQ